MANRMNKKAVFFSLASLFLVLMIVLDFRVATRVDIDRNKISAQNTRVKVMNNLVYDLEERYFDRMIYVASKASLREISKRGGNYDDLGETFTSVILNGNLTDGEIILENYTISYLVENIQEKFIQSGLVIEKLEIENVNLKQKSPWLINVELDIKYELNDKDNLAGWRGKIHKSVDVSIIGLYADGSKIKGSWTGGCISGCDENFLGRLDSKFLDGNCICK